MIQIPKKRGPKKKKMTQARVLKLKVRRVNANCRERSRMHGLNDALDELRQRVPCGDTAAAQKFSKIDTLRLARNYIAALSQVLQSGRPTDDQLFARTLSEGLSQNTANMVTGCVTITPTDSASNNDPLYNCSSAVDHAPSNKRYSDTGVENIDEGRCSASRFRFSSGPLFNSTPRASPVAITTPMTHANVAQSSSITTCNGNSSIYDHRPELFGSPLDNSQIQQQQQQQQQQQHINVFDDSGVQMNFSMDYVTTATPDISSSTVSSLSSTSSSTISSSHFNYQPCHYDQSYPYL